MKFDPLSCAKNINPKPFICNLSIVHRDHICLAYTFTFKVKSTGNFIYCYQHIFLGTFYHLFQSWKALLGEETVFREACMPIYAQRAPRLVYTHSYIFMAFSDASNIFQQNAPSLNHSIGGKDELQDYENVSKPFCQQGRLSAEWGQYLFSNYNM